MGLNRTAGQVLVSIAVLLTALVAAPLVVVAFFDQDVAPASTVEPLCAPNSTNRELTLEQVEDLGRVRFPAKAKLCWSDATGFKDPGMKALVTIPAGVKFEAPTAPYGILNTEAGSPGEGFASYLSDYELTNIRWASNYADPVTYPLRWIATGDGSNGERYVYLAYADG